MKSESASPPDLDSLAALAAAQDRSATEALLRALHPRIIRYCYSRIGRSPSTFADAEDVTQEVLIGALYALPRYRNTGSGFLSFVLGIANHKIADFHRRNARERTTPMEAPEIPDPRADPEQVALDKEQSEWAHDLLDTLPPTQRKIVVLRVITGLSSEETAEAVSSTSGAVRVTQHRALTKLRRGLAQPCPVP